MFGLKIANWSLNQPHLLENRVCKSHFLFASISNWVWRKKSVFQDNFCKHKLEVPREIQTREGWELVLSNFCWTEQLYYSLYRIGEWWLRVGTGKSKAIEASHLFYFNKLQNPQNKNIIKLLCQQIWRNRCCQSRI